MERRRGPAAESDPGSRSAASGATHEQRVIPDAPHPRGLGRDVSKVQALIARQARAPLIDPFSLPGGLVEVGETLAAAPAQELREEVSVEAEIIAFHRHVQARLSTKGG